MTSPESSKSLTIEDKIQRARDLFQAWHERIASDPHLTDLLARLETRAARSREIMEELGITACCMSCEVEEGGSCCGAGIENRYTPTLLLINLLLGRKLPQARRWSNSCYFLEETGCSLTARHVLCINYLCTKIQEKLTREELMRLQNTTGEEMDTGFLLHEKIQKIL